MTCPCNSLPCVCPPCSDTFGCRCPRHFVGPLPTTGLASAESPPTGPPCATCGHTEDQHEDWGCTDDSGLCPCPCGKFSPVPAAAPLRPAREVAGGALEDAERILENNGVLLRGLEGIVRNAFSQAFESAVLADRATRPEVAEVERLRELLRDGASAVELYTHHKRTDEAFAAMVAWARRAADRRGEL